MDLLKPIFEVKPGTMVNGEYRVEVWSYAFGQYRIILMRRDDPITMVRQMCTYKRGMFTKTVIELASAGDPESYCEALAKPWNCEAPGARIRLDNTPEDRPELMIDQE